MIFAFLPPIDTGGIQMGPLENINQFLNAAFDTIWDVIQFAIDQLPRFLTFLPATALAILAGVFSVVVIIRIVGLFL